LVVNEENTRKFNETHEESSYEDYKGQMNKETEKEAKVISYINNKYKKT
jgi:hypothetical protein